MKVHVPSPLHSYTRRRAVDARGETLADVLLDLDRQFTGIRLCMIDEQVAVRMNMRIFVSGEQEFDLARPLAETDSIHIVQALSCG